MTLLTVPLYILKLVRLFKHKIKILIFGLAILLKLVRRNKIVALLLLYQIIMLNIDFTSKMKVDIFSRYLTLLPLKCRFNFLFLLLGLLGFFFTIEL